MSPGAENISFEIGTIVLEGIALSTSERSLLDRTIRRELTRLAMAGPTGDWQDRAAASQQPPALQLTRPLSAGRLGRQVAATIWGSVRP